MPKGQYKRIAGVNCNDWTSEEDEKLREFMAIKGTSFGDAAQKMLAAFPRGRKYTRNMVLGRGKRLGIKSTRQHGDAWNTMADERTPRPAKDKMVRIKKPVPSERLTETINPPLARSMGAIKRVRLTKEEIAIRRLGHVPQIVEAAPATSKPLFECGDHECKWPTSTDVRSMEVCGAPSTFGAYCDKHGALAYTLAPTRKRHATMKAPQLEHTVRLEHEGIDHDATPPAITSDAPPLMLEYHPQDEEAA